MYKDSFYRGQIWRVNTDVAHFKHLGCNDVISSLKVGVNTVAECYVDAEYKGKSASYRGNVPQLGQFNDEARFCFFGMHVMASC